MKKQSKKFMLAGVVLLAIAGLLALTSCKNDSVPEPPSEADWLQEQKKELEDKTEGTYTITAPSYLTKGGLVDLAKLLHGLSHNVLVDLDLSQATGLTYIATGTFIRCPTLRSVKLPSSVTEIGKYAFAYTGLTEVTIPASVTEIGSHAFHFCTALTKVTIPEGVTTIGDNAFSYCENLTSVTFQKTDGWHLQDPVTNEIYDDPIDVSKPKDNATNLKDSAGQWYGEHLIRVES